LEPRHFRPAIGVDRPRTRSARAPAAIVDVVDHVWSALRMTGRRSRMTTTQQWEAAGPDLPATLRSAGLEIDNRHGVQYSSFAPWDGQQQQRQLTSSPPGKPARCSPVQAHADPIRQATCRESHRIHRCPSYYLPLAIVIDHSSPESCAAPVRSPGQSLAFLRVTGQVFRTAELGESNHR